MLSQTFGTNLDDFRSSVSHGQRTGVESRGGREYEQLAHLVHTTVTHTYTNSDLEQLIPLETSRMFTEQGNEVHP